jgi:hypothetical protein
MLTLTIKDEQASGSIDLTEDEAHALAQFVKRIGWSEFAQCSSNDNETHLIRAGVAKLQSALAQAGFGPR